MALASLQPGLYLMTGAVGYDCAEFFGLSRPQDTAFHLSYTLIDKVHVMDVEQNRKPSFIIEEAAILSKDLLKGLSDVCYKALVDIKDNYKPFGVLLLFYWETLGSWGQSFEVARRRRSTTIASGYSAHASTTT
ncbi:hypothetical protein BG015_001700 [Linnemannia schmuckeri]|uniref:Uncharacterized protein n=1 Tax=Linnemannia schmuckeri TaxID=64567 RepID=A0A9P5RPH4_9FUNG|nr:hypothetical protein BG015_001700 [Linnemannia schmuckeri]